MSEASDPFTLRAHVGGTGDGKRYKTVAALRGSKEAEGKYGSLTLPLALSQVITFYTGEYFKVKGVGWTIQKANFWIVAGNPNADFKVLGGHQEPGSDEIWGYYIAGHFDVLAEGDGKTRALRLLKWWLEYEPTIPRRIGLARFLGKQIGIKGQKEPGPMFKPGEYDIEIDDAPVFNPAEWDIEL